MKIIKLSPRLKAIADLIEPGRAVADIGTDHAYLPIYLVQQGIAPKAVAVDIHQGPFQSAADQVRQQKLTDLISVRLGNGLEPISVGEIEMAVLAGMGSATIEKILEAKPDLVTDLKQLVLQPMVGIANLRLWLSQNHWRIDKEVLVADENHIYVIISAKPGEDKLTDWLTLELGPVILREKPPLFVPYLEKLIADLTKVFISLEKTESQEGKIKQSQIGGKIKLLQQFIK
ncbi:class I SAM-dependent methyltransferase [Bacillota bacterium LX-D]|nr:class I SAM-dependent methyltransferase [Bacillota bacterium LX-D]